MIDRYQVRFDFTLWSSCKETNGGYVAHCPEINTTYEAKTLGKLWFTAVEGISADIDRAIHYGIIEESLLRLGWTVIKSHNSITYLSPIPDLRIQELRHVFQEDGLIERHYIVRDLTPIYATQKQGLPGIGLNSKNP